MEIKGNYSSEVRIKFPDWVGDPKQEANLAVNGFHRAVTEKLEDDLGSTNASTDDASNSTNWREFAYCRGMDTDIFYPEGRGRAVKIRENIAKQICADCPVVYECLEEARETQERFGVWGGLSESERGWGRRS